MTTLRCSPPRAASLDLALALAAAALLTCHAPSAGASPISLIEAGVGEPERRARGPAPPVVIWTTNPVLPNETAVLKTPVGASFGSATASVMLCDGDGSACEDVALAPGQAWERSAKFTIPAGRTTGAVWAVRARASNGTTVGLARLNDADPWNAACHNADVADPAGSVGELVGDPTACKPGVSTLRIFGRGLGWAGGVCVNHSASSAPGLTVARLTPLHGGGTSKRAV